MPIMSSREATHENIMLEARTQSNTQFEPQLVIIAGDMALKTPAHLRHISQSGLSSGQVEQVPLHNLSRSETEFAEFKFHPQYIAQKAKPLNV